MVLVALTGWGRDEHRHLSQEAGFDFHVVKPVEPASMENLLAKRIRTKPPQGELDEPEA